tara:strand:+ start:907 stop:1104 length:198 start_codon:yes stop_codon:yes gene_type:complete
MHNIYIDNFPDAYGMITHYLIKCFKERRNDRKNHFIFYQIINKKRKKLLKQKIKFTNGKIMRDLP